MTIQINAAVIPDTKSDIVLEALCSDFSEVNWTIVEEREADIVFSFGERQGPKTVPTLSLREDADKSELAGCINSAIKKGLVILPTALGREELQAQIFDSVTNLKKLRDNNPLILPSDESIGDDLVTVKSELAAHLLHGPALSRYCPDLEKVLSGRSYRTLQRKVPSWFPLAPMTDSKDINDLYPTLPLNGEALRKRVDAVSDRIEKLGVKPSLSVLDASQLNLGIPTPGGMHRDAEKLKDPDDDLTFYMQHAAKFMMRGMARAFEDDPDGFHQLNTRVGVKVDNYQGAILNTKSHPVRQTLWSIMLNSPKGIFHFNDLFAISASGFRTQSNGAGKKRPSYILLGQNSVGKSRAIDGEDLDGALVAVYNEIDTVEPSFERDNGLIGGRKRIVANVESAQNDSLLAVPSYIAKFKDKLYKWLYQQDLDILSRFVSDSEEFVRFWTEGYENWPLLRERVKKNFGITNVKDFIHYIRDVGEIVLCGDVVQYDASATWNFVKPFDEALLSSEALDVAEKIYNADKVGVYTDHQGLKRYYYVTCTPDDSFPDWYNELVLKTRADMSSLPSGLAITAQNGRGPVRAVLDHIAERVLIKLGESKSTARDIVTWMPEFTEEATFCFSSAFMNDGGDDHNLGMLVLHLLTGAPMFDCKDTVYEVFDNYEFLKLLPEDPKMNCGFKFHDDENERCIAISLSEGRMVDNTLYPEYPRSALGLHSSISNYVNSAYGTPAESTMVELAHIIACDIYGFDSLDHLAIIAAAEDEYLVLNQDFLPARQQIALLLGIPENDLEWQYTLDELLELGIDDSLLNMYRKPIPDDLTRDPAKFFNMETIKSLTK